MPPLDDKERGVALNYLETAYPPRSPAGRPGWQNPVREVKILRPML